MTQILTGDCQKILKKECKNTTFDMIITSPPYDKMRLYKRKVSWSFDKFKAIAKTLYTALKDGGVMIWIVGDETKNHNESGTSFKQALYFQKIGFKLADTMIFEKVNPLPGRRPSLYRQSFEYIFVLSKGKMKTFNPIMVNTVTTKTVYRKENKWSMETGKTTTCPKKKLTPEKRYHNNIFSYVVGGNKINHPAVFPIQLAKDMIYTYSNEGDLILDPMAGSGTSAIAAKELNRNCIAIEIVEEYANTARQRLYDFNKQTTLNF